MPQINVTSAAIAGIAGALISLILSYFPGLNTKFAALPKESQQLIMAGLMLLTTVVVMALGCYKIVQIDLTCDQAGWVQAIWMFLTAIMANQATFKLSPQPAGVQSARAARE
jgi:hypothetical protein